MPAAKRVRICVGVARVCGWRRGDLPPSPLPTSLVMILVAPRSFSPHLLTYLIFCYKPRCTSTVPLQDEEGLRHRQKRPSAGEMKKRGCGSPRFYLQPCSVGVSSSVEAVSIDTIVGVSEQVSGQCRSSVGQCWGFLTMDLLGPCRAVSECRSVGVSECQSVGRCEVGVSEWSECRSVEALRASCLPPDPTTLCCDEGKVGNAPLSWRQLAQLACQLASAGISWRQLASAGP